jgi:hypothetical protein
MVSVVRPVLLTRDERYCCVGWVKERNPPIDPIRRVTLRSTHPTFAIKPARDRHYR